MNLLSSLDSVNLLLAASLPFEAFYEQFMESLTFCREFHGKGFDKVDFTNFDNASLKRPDLLLGVCFTPKYVFLYAYHGKWEHSSRVKLSAETSLSDYLSAVESVTKTFAEIVYNYLKGL
jgi:hypothetical protein